MAAGSLTKVLAVVLKWRSIGARAVMNEINSVNKHAARTQATAKGELTGYRRFAEDIGASSYGRAKRFGLEHGYRYEGKGHWRDLGTGLYIKYEDMLQRLPGYEERARRSTQRFRFEFLSLMFAGMQLQRVFDGWIKQVLKMTGVTDMLNIVMTLFLIPVIKELLPLFKEWFVYLTSLDPATKNTIGKIMILTTVGGGLLFVISEIILALNGAMIVFSSFAAFVGVVGKAISTSIVLQFAAAIVALAVFVNLIKDAIAFLKVLRGEMSLTKASRESMDRWNKTFWPIKQLVPKLGSGGIVTRPTLAMIGERGPEAVVPLSAGFSPTINVEANVASTIDIDYLARRLSGRLGELYEMERKRYV